MRRIEMQGKLNACVALSTGTKGSMRKYWDTRIAHWQQKLDEYDKQEERA